MLPVVMLMLMMANLSIAISQLSLGLGLFLLLVGRFGGGLTVARTGLEKSALLLGVWALLMVPLSTDAGQSLVFYRRFYLFAALWLVATVANSELNRRLLLTALVLGAAAISLYGQWHVFRETGALFQVRLGEMSNPMTSGCLLMMALLTIMAFLISGDLGSQRARWLLVISAVPISVGLLQTLTRGAWLGMLAGGMVILAMLRPRLVAAFVVLLVLVMVLMPRLPESVISKPVAERFSLAKVISGPGGSERLKMWRGGWQMVRQHPLTGLGDRDLTEVSPEYYGDEETDYYGHLHSNPVMLLVIWGVPGFLLASFFLGRQGWLLWRRWRLPAMKNQPWRRGWVLAGMGVWVGFMVAGLTEWYFGDAESMLLYLGIMGAALAENGEVHA